MMMFCPTILVTDYAFCTIDSLSFYILEYFSLPNIILLEEFVLKRMYEKQEINKTSTSCSSSPIQIMVK